MQKLRPVLWIWPCTAALLLLNQPQLTKLHSDGFEENVPSSRPSLPEKVLNFGVITYYRECPLFARKLKCCKFWYCHVFYEGQVHGFKREGNGEMNYADGSVYSGQWRDDKREGYGIMYDARAFVYEGEWGADKRHGQGVLKIGNDFRYFQIL